MPIHSTEFMGGGSSLPPEVWVAAMEYLPCSDVLSCAASSRTILCGALPLLKTLHIDTPFQMNAVVAARCGEVRELRINCLFRENAGQSEGPDYRALDVDPETSLRVVPFLTRFGRLVRVAFGGQRGDGDRTAIDRFSPAECHYLDDDENDEYSLGKDEFVSAVESISAAFRVGALPRSLRVSGLCCPTLVGGGGYDPYDGDPTCEVCERACRSFPLRAVAGFDSGRGTARVTHSSGNSRFRVCLTHAQIEGIVESRPGGREALCSEDRMLDLLRDGERFEVPSDDGGAFHVLKFGEGRLREIKRIIRYAGTDLHPGGIDADSIANAILSGFVVGSAIMPPKIKRYVSEDSIKILAGYGLSVDAGKLNASLNDYVQALPQIGRVLLEHWSDECDLHDIQIDCLTLIRSFLEMECDPPIQAIIDLGLVPTMMIWMKLPHRSGHRRELGRIANAILSRGTEEQRMTFLATDDKVLASIKSQLKSLHICGVEYGPKFVIAAISTQLSASDTGDIECALLTLGCILDEKSDYATISTLSDAGVIPKLVRLLKRERGNNAIVGRSLDALTLLSKHCAMEADLLPAVVENMGLVDSVRKSKCFVLLGRILKSSDAPVQKAIDLGVVPIVLEGVKSNAEPAIRANAARVVIRLARGAAAETKSLSHDQDYILAFVGLIQSSNKPVALEAIGSVESIAKWNPELYQRVSEAGAVQRIWHIMQESKEDSDMLTKAIRAVTECARRGKPSDHITVNSMRIMSQELVAHPDSAVAVNACQGVFSILESFQEQGLDMVQCKEYVNNHFVKTILSLPTQSKNRVNAAVIEVVHFLTTIGESFVRCLFENHCLQFLKEMLLIPHYSHERLHKPVCDAIVNIISGNADRIAGVISTGAMPVLVERLANGGDRVKGEAFNVLYQVVKGGTDTHVKHVTSLGLVDHLVRLMYTNNANNLLPTLWMLRKIYQVCSKGWQSCQTRSKNANLQLVENVISDLMDEHLRLEHQKKRIDLLKKKKALLKYIYKRKDVILLENLCSKLKGQSIEMQRQVQKIKNTITAEQSLPGSAEEVSLKLLFTLQEQRDGKKARNDKKIKIVQDKLRKAKSDLEWDFSGAVGKGEMEKWQKSSTEELEKLVKDDLPSDIAGTEVSLERSSGTVKLINTLRLSEQRKLDIEALKTGLGGILGIKSGCVMERPRGDTQECLRQATKKRRFVLDTEPELERSKRGKNEF